MKAETKIDPSKVRRLRRNLSTGERESAFIVSAEVEHWQWSLQTRQLVREGEMASPERVGEALSCSGHCEWSVFFRLFRGQEVFDLPQRIEILLAERVPIPQRVVAELEFPSVCAFSEMPASDLTVNMSVRMESRDLREILRILETRKYRVSLQLKVPVTHEDDKNMLWDLGDSTSAGAVECQVKAELRFARDKPGASDSLGGGWRGSGSGR